MKYYSSFFAALALLFATGAVCGQERFSENETAYESSFGGNNDAATCVIYRNGGERCQRPFRPDQIAVKIWFTDERGRPYNPELHKFGVREPFHIWVESNFDVQFALFQNYPEDRPATKQVYPNPQDPRSNSILRGRTPVKVPGVFYMDRDLRNEIVSIVVSKVGYNGNRPGPRPDHRPGYYPDNRPGYYPDNRQGNRAPVDYPPQNPRAPREDFIPPNMPSGNDFVKDESGNLDDNMLAALSSFAEENSDEPAIAVDWGPGNTIPRIENGRRKLKTYPANVCIILYGYGNIVQKQLTLHK